MRYLLDTHAFLWYFEDSDKLSETAANVVSADDKMELYYVPSVW